MNALFQGAVEMKQIDKQRAVAEIDALIKWQEERKKWHQDKTRQKMAAEGTTSAAVGIPPSGSHTNIVPNGSDAVNNNTGGTPQLPPTSNPSAFRSSDFGLNADDIADLQDEYDDSSDGDSDDDDIEGGKDPIAGERKRRQKIQDRLRRSAGEPVKPEVKELKGMREGFLAMLRMVLAD